MKHRNRGIYRYRLSRYHLDRLRLQRVTMCFVESFRYVESEWW